MHGVKVSAYRIQVGNLEEKKPLGILNVSGMIILK
jgi:hypothetical protein